MNRSRTLLVILAATLAACSTSVPTDTPGVTQSARYVMQYDGPELRAELVFRWASLHLGEEHLLLKLSLSAPGGASPVVEAENIRMRTPDGRELPMRFASQSPGSVR